MTSSWFFLYTLNQKNLEIQIRVQNLLHTPAPGPFYGWIKFPTALRAGWSPLGSSPLRNVLSRVQVSWQSQNNHNPRTTPNPLHPLMAANRRTTTVHYVERKCRRVPGSVPAGTTFQPALTARLNSLMPRARADLSNGTKAYLSNISICLLYL